MGFFRRRKTEEIHLTPLDNSISNQKEPQSPYSENEPVISQTTLSDFELTVRIDELLTQLHKHHETLINAYYTCKIFSRIAMQDKDFLIQMETIDRHIERIEQEMMVISHDITDASHPKAELYSKMMQLQTFFRGVSNRIDDIFHHYFNHLKIATINACRNKTNNDLETLYKNISLFLNDYKDINQAAEYVFFNSGQIIVKTIQSLVHYLHEEYKDNAKPYSLSYFLPSDAIITLTLTEWIELYNKIKFVMKMTNGKEPIHHLAFRNSFIQFEMRYIILMMYLETNPKNTKISQFNM